MMRTRIQAQAPSSVDVYVERYVQNKRTNLTCSCRPICPVTAGLFSKQLGKLTWMGLLDDEHDEEEEGRINDDSCQSFEPHENEAPEESILEEKLHAAKGSSN